MGPPLVTEAELCWTHTEWPELRSVLITLLHARPRYDHKRAIEKHKHNDGRSNKGAWLCVVSCFMGGVIDCGEHAWIGLGTLSFKKIDLCGNLQLWTIFRSEHKGDIKQVNLSGHQGRRGHKSYKLAGEQDGGAVGKAGNARQSSSVKLLRGTFQMKSTSKNSIYQQRFCDMVWGEKEVEKCWSWWRMYWDWVIMVANSLTTRRSLHGVGGVLRGVCTTIMDSLDDALLLCSEMTLSWKS